jgi:hypothetical protein
LSIGVIIGLALVVPLGAGEFLDGVVGSNINELKTWSEEHAFFSAGQNFVYLFISIGGVIGLVFPITKKRRDLVTPQTEVSESRANMQESVHPNENSINIENIGLANRRDKEVPNRKYADCVPKLKEQAEGKGSPEGE